LIKKQVKSATGKDHLAISYFLQKQKREMAGIAGLLLQWDFYIFVNRGIKTNYDNNNHHFLDNF
jgi:hypothetical protein